MHESIKTINSPEFINLKPSEISPLMSSCEIKVLYVGENRNRSYITKEVATEMAKTLRGAPIVGYWRADVEDFGDHGQRMTIDVDGIKFECLTRPYGFVSPDAKVWFQTFEDKNEFNEVVSREYLMTTGYLWTEQYQECKSALEGEGKPHSMELDENTLKGHWSENNKGVDFFIIDDATFSKLCILGDDVEPCFEGSKVSTPDVSVSFTKLDNDFKNTLFSMMQDLKNALEGGTKVEEETIIEEVAPAASEDPQTAAPAQFTTEPDQTEPTIDDNSDGAPAVDAEIKNSDVLSLDEVFYQLQKDYDALKAEHEELKTNYSALEEKYNSLQETSTELLNFQKKVQDEEKDRMIEKFSMLSDEDKANVVSNKDKYTVEEIEEKLSVICFRKKINFDLNNESSVDTNFTVNVDYVSNNEPAWLSAVKNNRKNKN